MLRDEGIFSIIAMIVVAGCIIYYIRKARSGAKLPEIRRIAGLDAIEEAVGRATEMGRMVHFTPGIANINEITAAQTFAGLETLGLVARMVARYGAKIFVSIRQPLVYPLAEEIVRQAFMAEGQIEAFDPDSVQYLSSNQFAYAAAVMGIVQRERCAANILLGGFWAESLMIAEAGSTVGAIQIAGTANLHQIPFFVTACDYCLIGEELYAAGALASGNPIKLASIAGQDLGKLFGVALVIIGTLAQTFGLTGFMDLLK